MMQADQDIEKLSKQSVKLDYNITEASYHIPIVSLTGSTADIIYAKIFVDLACSRKRVRDSPSSLDHSKCDATPASPRLSSPYPGYRQRTQALVYQCNSVATKVGSYPAHQHPIR